MKEADEGKEGEEVKEEEAKGDEKDLTEELMREIEGTDPDCVQTLGDARCLIFGDTLGIKFNIFASSICSSLLFKIFLVVIFLLKYA